MEKFILPKLLADDFFEESIVKNNLTEEQKKLLKKVYTSPNPMSHFTRILNYDVYKDLSQEDKKQFEELWKLLLGDKSFDVAKYVLQKFPSFSIPGFYDEQEQLLLNLKETFFEISQKELEKERKQKEDLQSKILKMEDVIRELSLDFDQYKNRVERENKKMVHEEAKRKILGILTVLDSFEQGLSSISSSVEEGDPLYSGMKMVFDQFQHFLEIEGVESVKVLGQSFDPNIHEAIQIIDVNDPSKDGKVIEEWKKGYFYKNDLLRHAKVVVGKLSSSK